MEPTRSARRRSYRLNGGGTFAGESMFRLEPNASEPAILLSNEHPIFRELGRINIQVLPPFKEAMEAKLVRSKAFLKQLQVAHEKNFILFDIQEKK